MPNEFESLLGKISCFSNKEKIAILAHLTKSESSVAELARHLEMGESTVYKYLQQMVKAGVVAAEKGPGRGGKLAYKLCKFRLDMSPNKLKKLTEERNKIRAIIFDVDDCLIRRKDIPAELSNAGTNAVKEAISRVKQKGVSITMPPSELFSEEWIEAKYGNNIPWFISTWLSIAGLPDGKTKEEITRKYVEQYFRRIEKTGPKNKPFKDVKPLLKELARKKIKIGAMSNSSRKTVEKTFKRNKISQYFSAIVGGDEFPKSREAVQMLLKKLKAKKENSMVVGDSGRDIEVGREAGIAVKNVIGVYRGITPLENIESINPKAPIIKDLRALLKLI